MQPQMTTPAPDKAVRAEKYRTQSERGRRAQEILDDRIFKDVIKAVQDEIDKGWKTSKPEDVVARERAYFLSEMLEMFVSKFRAIAQNGRDAKVLLERLDLEERPSNGKSR